MLTICMMRVGNSHPNYNAWYKNQGAVINGNFFVELLTDTAVVGELHQPECIPLTFDRDGIT